MVYSETVQERPANYHNRGVLQKRRHRSLESLGKEDKRASHRQLLLGLAMQ